MALPYQQTQPKANHAKMFSPSRHLVSLFCITALLFAQLAVAAYACPTETKIHAAAAMHDCCVDEVAPSLCQKHCEDGSQNVSNPPPPLPPATISSTGMLNTLALASDSLATPKPAPFLHHATAPPLAIRHCCLRI